MSQARTRCMPTTTRPPETIWHAMDVVEIAEPHSSLERACWHISSPLLAGAGRVCSVTHRLTTHWRLWGGRAIALASDCTTGCLAGDPPRPSGRVRSELISPGPTQALPVSGQHSALLSRSQRFTNQLMFAHPGHTRRIGAKPKHCEQFASREPARGCGGRAMVQGLYHKPKAETSGRGGRRETPRGPSRTEEMLRAFTIPTALWRQHL